VHRGGREVDCTVWPRFAKQLFDICILLYSLRGSNYPVIHYNFFKNSFRNGIFSSPFRKRPIFIFMLLPLRAIKTATAAIIVRYNYGVFVSISIPICEVYYHFTDEHHSRSIGFSRPVISVYLAGNGGDAKII